MDVSLKFLFGNIFEYSDYLCVVVKALAYEIPHKVPNGRRQDIKKTQNYNMAVF
jgi:hypothetical protein